MFKRKIVAELDAWRDCRRSEALLVKGARQVGKTFIIDHYIEANFESHVKIDMRENPGYRRIFDGDISSATIVKRIESLFPDFKIVDGKTAIFIDEIQLCPNARMALKYMSTDGRYKVIASGSLLGLTYNSEVNANPVGYERDVEMIPMDFEEFLWAMDISQKIIDDVRCHIHEKKSFDSVILDVIDRYFLTYCAVGGMPEAVSEFKRNDRSISAARTVQRKIVDGYRDDVARYSKSTERDRVMALFDSIPSQIGFDSKRFVFRDVENKVASMRTYQYGIRWMIDAGMVRKCNNLFEPKLPLESNVNINYFRIFVNDTGLMMSRFDDDIVKGLLSGDHRINKGALIENAVAQNIYAHDRRLHYFAKDFLEIDFITVMGMDVAAIEVKSGNNRRSKSLTSLRDRYSVRRRMKFEKGNLYVDDQGVEHYPLFACAFLDAMYEPVTLRVDLPKL